jgi:hypothetical protein
MDATGQHIKVTYDLLMTHTRPLISVVSDGELRSLARQWTWGEDKNEQTRFLLGYFKCVSIRRPGRSGSLRRN